MIVKDWLHTLRHRLFMPVYPFLSHNNKLLEELHFAQLYRDSTLDCPWLTYRGISPNGAAASYSMLYVIFRILSEMKPQCILELGTGQSSVVLSQYVADGPGEAVVDMVDESATWIEHLKPKLKSHPNIHIHHLPLQTRQVQGKPVQVYKGLAGMAKAHNRTYDFILVDGPSGTGDFHRVGCIELIPNHLNSQGFVILVDDTHRIGERHTVSILTEKLKSMSVPFATAEIHATKSQTLIYSPERFYLGSL